MSQVGQIERITQNRVVKLFKEQLGYTYLGNWEFRQNNSNIDYISIVNLPTLKDIKEIKDKIMIALAVYIGKTRLIDNVILNVDEKR